jgi:long-chain fatty acid transport protein
MRSILTVVVVACLVLTAASTLQAAGFEVAEQSGRLLGNAYAGKAAEAAEPSIAFFNPAGMTKFTSLTGAITAQYLVTGGEFEDTGSYGVALGKMGLMPKNPTGGDGDDPGTKVIIPCLNVVMPIECPLSGEQVFLGLTVNAPYGLTTDYEKGWMGRYHALESHLETLSINPSIAYRLTTWASIGVGGSYQRAEAKLSNAIDFGTIGLATLGPATATKMGLFPEAADGEAVIEGDSWAWGWNMGLLFDLSEGSRVGISYRSHIVHELEGDVDFTVPSSASVLTGTGMFTDADATARITLPEQVYLSGYFEIFEELAMLTDVTWTRWSRFKELRAVYDSPQPDTVTPEDWNDVYRVSLGFKYEVMDGLYVRTGIAYDESPIPTERRTARVPTGDRTWYSIGASYDVSDTIVADASFMYVRIAEGHIDDFTATGQRLEGDFQGNAYVIGVNVTMSF